MGVKVVRLPPLGLRKSTTKSLTKSTLVKPKIAKPTVRKSLGPLPRGVLYPKADASKGLFKFGNYSKAVSAVVLGAAGVSSLVSASPVMALGYVENTDADLVNLSHSDISTEESNLAEGPNPVRMDASVGPHGANRASDVRAIQQRLKDLGFRITVDGEYGPQTERALKTFESIIRGTERGSDVNGTIRNGTTLHRMLESNDAPRWVEVPKSGVGFHNVDADNHDFGTTHLVEVLKDCAKNYHHDYWSAHPDSARIATNDASVPSGGDTHDHHTHENGLDLDLRLPRKDGGSGSRTDWSNYDHNASYAMVEAFAEDDRVERVIISDPLIHSRIAASQPSWGHKVFDGGKSHKSHIHVDVAPPRLRGFGSDHRVELKDRPIGPVVIT